jgi:Double-GTPase 1
MMARSKLLVIGFPEAGKTTFLAALWHVAESGEVQGSLQLERISEDARHLNSIKDNWLLCRRVGRTQIPTEQSVSLWLRDEGNDTIGEVVFPDLSGETFQNQWNDRHWTRAYAELVSEASCVLLFLHPGKIKEPYTVADMQKMAEAAFPETADDEGYQQEQESGAAAGVTESWIPELAPTQVQLVGLLQFLEPHLPTRSATRVAIIISAWDVVDHQGDDGTAAPVRWLERRLPYLVQYLQSHFESVQFRVYGVSAQGGDLDADRERLQEYPTASERIGIHGLDCSAHDITEPVRWALGLRESRP